MTYWETVFNFELTHNQPKTDPQNTYALLAIERQNLIDDIRRANLREVNFDVINWWIDNESEWQNVSDNADVYIQRIDISVVVRWRQIWDANGTVPMNTNDDSDNADNIGGGGGGAPTNEAGNGGAV